MMNQPQNSAIPENIPLISIGMPVYNGDRYLREALEAILNQTCTNFEVIISDNGSTDSTPQICQEYLLKDSRIRYYRQSENIGGSGNFNFVFNQAKGTYFKWAAYDDLCAKEYLEKCLEILDKEPSIVLVYPQAHDIDEQGNDLGEYTANLNIRSLKPHERFFKHLETYGWCHATQAFGLMRTDALKTTALLGNYAHADRVLLAEIALRGEFAEVPEVLFFRRIHAQNSQATNKTDEELTINWFDPKNKGKLLLPLWRRYSEYFKIVNRANLPFGEKINCYLQIIRRFLISPGLLVRLKGIFKELEKVLNFGILSFIPNQQQKHN